MPKKAARPRRCILAAVFDDCSGQQDLLNSLACPGKPGEDCYAKPV
jgi:hypothetical protein